MLKIIHEIISVILDIFYPPSTSCYLCRLRIPDEGHEVCPACYEALARIKGPVCARCGGMGDFWDEDEMCARCTSSAFSFGKARSAFVFEDDVSRMIYAIKFGRAPYLCREFAAAMLPILREISPDYVVPVPLHPKRQRKRGYNQSEILCDAMAELSLINENREILMVSALERRINTSPQMRLSVKKRLAQMKQDVFGPTAAAGLIVGRHVALIDDVFTTGATIDACARVLVKAGAARVDVITICMARGGKVQV